MLNRIRLFNRILVAIGTITTVLFFGCERLALNPRDPINVLLFSNLETLLIIYLCAITLLSLMLTLTSRMQGDFDAFAKDGLAANVSLASLTFLWFFFPALYCV